MIVPVVVASLLFLFLFLFVRYVSFPLSPNYLNFIKQANSSTACSPIYCLISIFFFEVPRRFQLKKIVNKYKKELQSLEIKYQFNNLKLSEKEIENYRTIILESKKNNSNDGPYINETLMELLYLYSLIIGKTQLVAISQNTFPLPIVGSVHLSNEFILFKHLNKDEKFDVHLSIGNFHKHQKGILFEMNSKVIQNNTLFWQSKSTFLYFTKHNQFDSNSQSNKDGIKTIKTKFAEAGNADISAEYFLPLDTGKKFASVCGDYNPIHLYRFAAKLFGFRSCIAHGACTLAKSVCFIPKSDQLNQLPISCSVYFLKPLLLPATVNIQCTKASPTNQILRAYDSKKNADYLLAEFTLENK